MCIFLKKLGMLKFGFSLVVMIVAVSVQVKILVYCLEGFLEGFNLQLFIFGIIYDVFFVLFYNCLVEFKIGIIEVILGFVEKWEVSEDGKIYIFYLCKGVKWYDNKEFKLMCELNVDDVVFLFDCQKNV